MSTSRHMYCMYPGPLNKIESPDVKLDSGVHASYGGLPRGLQGSNRGDKSPASCLCIDTFQFYLQGSSFSADLPHQVDNIPQPHIEPMLRLSYLSLSLWSVPTAIFSLDRRVRPDNLQRTCRNSQEYPHRCPHSWPSWPGTDLDPPDPNLGFSGWWARDALRHG